MTKNKSKYVKLYCNFHLIANSLVSISIKMIQDEKVHVEEIVSCY